VIRHPDGRVYRHVIQFQDISEQKQKDEVIWRQTNFDPLTGLPNRRLFLDRLQQDMKKAQGAGRRLGVLLLDIDRFKDINDSYGYARGDEALVELTRRMARCVPAEATVARLGGGMFALVVAEGEHGLHLETIAGALIEALGAPLRLGDEGLAYVSASIGISVYPDDADDAAALLAARRGTRCTWPSAPGAAISSTSRPPCSSRPPQAHAEPTTCAPRSRAGSCRCSTSRSSRRPRDACARPRRCCAGTSRARADQPGQLHSAGRGKRPDRRIGEWVLSEAIASIERWRQKYDCTIELSVNISPMQFERQGRLPWLDRILHTGACHQPQHHHRDHRGRAGERRRPGLALPRRAARRPAPRSRSTISAPAFRRWPT
jgi:diguanylate cyclase (GGDEF)-like protein